LEFDPTLNQGKSYAMMKNYYLIVLIRSVNSCSPAMNDIGASAIDNEAYRLMRAGRFSEALPLAERAVAGARVCLPGHGFLASILLQLGRARDAEQVVAQAATLETGAAEAYDGLAYVSVALGRHERANAMYRRATELSPQTPRYWYNLACSERGFGRLAEAEEACDRGIALDAAQYRTYLLRSELRVQAVAENHIAELQALVARPDLDKPARTFLGYALAKELDDVRRFDEAFYWFAAAAQARRSQMTYDIAGDEHRLRRIAEVFPGNAGGSVQCRLRGSPPRQEAARCIFIVGLPRSGTTLMERILTGLPGVRSNGETENFSLALAAAAPKGAGDMFERAAAADPDVVAANYARFAHLNASSDRIVEKLPTNYLYVGAIHRALPAAKILLVRRSPLDSCFAMYRTLFGEAYPFTYDCDELARYYAAYDRLMNHWRTVLGDELHEIVYEDLVRQPQLVGAAAARHCGLTWTSEAIDIQRNKSVSLTASAAQVRRPIYGSSSGHWRRYHRHLAPLIAALRRCGVSVPEDA
jgi:tetratricopeptide (TPR) repeat protein